MPISYDNFYNFLKESEEKKPEGSSVSTDVQKDPSPDSSTPVTIRNLFVHHDSHPIVLDIALLKVFGVEWFDWDQSTVWSEIKRLFNTDISEHSRAKIQTVKTLHISNLPWDKWQVFEKIIQGLNNNLPTWETMQVPSLAQLYAGVEIMGSLRSVAFSDEVKLYAASAVLAEEVTFVPPPLDFLQLEVSRPHYKCNDCGNEESALFHDGICSNCSKRMDPERGLSLQPDQDLVRMGIGKNITTVLLHDPSEVQKRWDDVKSKPASEIHLEETAEDIQVAKLLAAREYSISKNKQLADQLTNLKSWLGAE